MEIEDIKNPEIKKLALAAIKNASSTIGNDLHDALEGSNTDEELIENWQSALMDLYNEIQKYWGTLENMKIR